MNKPLTYGCPACGFVSENKKEVHMHIMRCAHEPAHMELGRLVAQAESL